jgi:hypothetical protein
MRIRWEVSVMERMKVKKIKVTADDISHGTTSDCLSCPIALAIRRIVKKNCRVEVRSLSVLIQVDDNFTRPHDYIDDEQSVHANGTDIPVIRLSLPQRARDFIDRFDSVGSPVEEYFSIVKPFSFELPIPVESLR